MALMRHNFAALGSKPAGPGRLACQAKSICNSPEHVLAYIDENGASVEDAALRVFGNADGAYGSNVNNLVGSGTFDDEDELADAYLKRKGFAYGVSGKPQRSDAVLAHALAGVEMTYQNLDSLEMGVTTVDHYFDTLGGI